MDLLSAAEKFSASDHFLIKFSASSCLHSLNKLASCEACFAVCPTAAIQPGKPPAFNAQACVACRACLQACPVGAFSGEDQAKHLLGSVARAVEKHKVNQIDLLCHRHTAPAQGPVDSQLGLRVPGCLAQLGVGAYLGLAVLGIEKVTVRLDDCAQCAWGMLKPQIIEQVGQAVALLNTWEKSAEIGLLEVLDAQNLRERPGWNADSPPLSRAELLRPATLLNQAKYEQLISPDPLAVRRHHLSLDRYRQTIAVNHLLAEEQPAGAHLTAPVNYVQARVNDACIGCNICSQACPTGAIRRTVLDENEFRLGFSPLICVSCGVCAALCPEDALTLESSAPAGYLLEGTILLHSGSLVKCQRCNTLFSPKAGEKLCPSCQFRQDHPFGSRLFKVKPG